MTDHYEILGADRNASQEEIKKAYKKQASKCHPDKNQNDPEATSKFQKLQKAYLLLSDPEKRERYDRTGADDKLPTLDEKANEVIAQMWLQLAERAAFQAQNYLLKVTKLLQDNLRQCKSEMKKFKNLHSKLEYLISKTEADPIMLNILQGKLHQMNHMHEQAKEGVTVMSRALELLDGYKYTGEVPAPGGGGTYPWMGTGEPYIV